MKKLITASLLLSMLLSVASCGEEKERVPDFPYVSDESGVLSAEGSAEDEPQAETSEGSEGSVSASADTDSAVSEDKKPEASVDLPEISFEVDENCVSLTDKAFTVYIIKGEENSYTVKAVVPAGVSSGKLVLTPSKNLTLKAGSLKTVAGNAVLNEKYDRDGVKGACIVFAFLNTLPANTVVFEAEYSAADGASITAADLTANAWNIAVDNVYIGSSDTDKAVIKYVG